jgi:hypothetical protein
VSIGRAPNIAAKLSDIGKEPSYRVYITEGVYDSLLDDAKYDNDGDNMWRRYETEVGGEWMTTYRTAYWWGIG